MKRNEILISFYSPFFSYVCLCVLCVFLVQFFLCQSIHSGEWANQTLQKMTLDEKIGQLFMAGSYPNQEDANLEGQFQPFNEYIENLILNYHIGGVIYKYRWDPTKQKYYINYHQSLSKIPLFAAQDLEWGLTMRVDNTLRFPKNMALGAIQDDSLIYAMGKEIGRESRLLGINFNFAPVVDVNNNPANPIINVRSFGDDPQRVAAKGIMMMRGLQDAGIIACAKHFPGHGDTATDSHHDLPILMHSRERLDSIELFPFRKLIQEGVMAVMSAHLFVPALDPENRPATLSPIVMRDLLQGELGFKGISVTDDLLMKAVAARYPSGEAALKAFEAGHHVIMSSKDVAEGFVRIKEAVMQGAISQQDLDQRVLKILETKEWLLEKGSLNPSKELINFESFHTQDGIALKRRLYESVVTVAQDSLGLIPTQGKTKIACIQVGGEIKAPFYAELNQKVNLPLYYMPVKASALEQKTFLNQLNDLDEVIIAIYEMKDKVMVAVNGKSEVSKDYGISESTQRVIKDLVDKKVKVVLVLFGNPYSVKMFGDSNASILVAYDDDPDAQQAAAQVITGELIPSGKMPVK